MTKLKTETQLPQAFVKCRFFAQYWEQSIAEYAGRTGVTINMNTINHLQSVFLKPLSKITDDDALGLVPFISKNFSSRYNDDYIKEQIKKEVLDAEKLPAKFYDILRSKGYALPFMEYSVEDLVSFGWVRLA